MPKVGGKRRKTRTHKEYDEDDQELLGNTPKAFVIKRGKVPNDIKSLVEDYREIMYPNTSMKLQDNDKTKIKDYIKAAQYYKIQHMVIFTATKKNCYLRFVTNPRGPTFTFRIMNYSNRNEVLNAQRKYKSFSRIFCAPLLVMNGFQKEFESYDMNTPNSDQIKLVGSMIQGMFPPINVKQAGLNTQKRVVLFTYKDDKIYVRHYYIGYNPKGIDKKMKKILKANKMPNLSQYNSFQDFLTNNHQMFNSDTEQSDLEEIEIENKKKSNSSQMSIRLYEVGPRLTLKLYKIEEGYLQGNVIFNRVVKKSNKAIEKLRKINRRKLLLKNKRRQEQEENVERKQNKQTKQPIEEDVEDRPVKKVKKQ